MRGRALILLRSKNHARKKFIRWLSNAARSPERLTRNILGRAAAKSSVERRG
jgi:hypothetical protein